MADDFGIGAMLEHRLQSKYKFEDFLAEKIKSLPEDTTFPCFLRTADFSEIFDKLSDLSVNLSRYMNVYFNKGGLFPRAYNNEVYGGFSFIDHKNGNIKISRFHERYDENLGQTYILIKPKELISYIDEDAKNSFFLLLGKEKECLWFLDKSRNPESLIEKGVNTIYPAKETCLEPCYPLPEHNKIINLHEENSFVLFCPSCSYLTSPKVRESYIKECINKASSC